MEVPLPREIKNWWICLQERELSLIHISLTNSKSQIAHCHEISQFLHKFHPLLGSHILQTLERYSSLNVVGDAVVLYVMKMTSIICVFNNISFLNCTFSKILVSIIHLFLKNEHSALCNTTKILLGKNWYTIRLYWPTLCLCKQYCAIQGNR